MSGSIRVTERCQTLHGIGQGLLNLIWSLKNNIATSSPRYPSLFRDDIAKIRKKLESSFPDVPDCSKVSEVPMEGEGAA